MRRPLLADPARAACGTGAGNTIKCGTPDPEGFRTGQHMFSRMRLL
ncbi:MAG: hypothetical protein WA102_08140 [Candidatus Methanoperedens sp.]